MVRNFTDTIAGIATPCGYGGIGIIRVSGPNAGKIALRLFRRKSSKEGGWCEASLQSHRLTLGCILENEKTPIDEVFCVFMKAPGSYTCEDVLEIQCHSGPVVLNKILSLVLNSGARLAEAGEFTRRAFLNGRIDLSQAEAVIDMINAKSETGLAVAAQQIGGQTRQFGEALVRQLDEFIAVLQAAIEFGDELGDENGLFVRADELKDAVIAPIQKACSNYTAGRCYREGLRLGIIGRPNVGKSSLLNCLLEKDKAIVSPYPGTTRDLVEDFFLIDGVPVTVTDTAGLHLPQDPVELIGVQKTREYLLRSDMVLFVTDAVQPFNDLDSAAFKEIPVQTVIIVINKIDLNPSYREIGVPEGFRQYPLIYVSALQRDGIAELKKALAQECVQKAFEPYSDSIVPNLRQKINLENALKDLENAFRALECRLSEEFVVNDLISAREWLGRMLGQYDEPETLDRVFERFCIGK